jgi:hypothetical protein
MTIGYVPKNVRRMTLCVSPTIDEAEWNAQLAALGSPIFHSPVWARYQAAHSNLSPRYCRLLDDGRAVRGVALLFLQSSTNPVLRKLSARMHSDAHPVVEANDTNLFTEMVRQMEVYADGAGALELTLGSFGTPGKRSLLEQLGYDLMDRYEFVLPLDRTDDEMRTAMERRRRRTIQKAIDAGITVDLLPYETGICELRRLQGFTSERLKQRGAIVDFDPVRPPDEDPVGELVKGGYADLIGARHDGKWVSVSLYTKMNGLAYSTLAGHAPEAYELNAYTLLLWSTMRHYREGLYRRMNIGGVPASASEESSPNFGLYGYKAGLGGIREACATASKILKPRRQKTLHRIRGLLGR